MYDDSSFADFVLALKNEWIRVRVRVCVRRVTHTSIVYCVSQTKSWVHLCWPQ